MPPRTTRTALGRLKGASVQTLPRKQQICLICSLSRPLRHPAIRSRIQTQQLQHRIKARPQSNLANVPATDTGSKIATKPPRAKLRDALVDLQKYAGSYINISRLQLALRGLEQTAGQETIRIAILGLADGGTSLRRAKELLRLLVADPLKDEEEWERILTDDQQSDRPLLLRVGHNGLDELSQSSSGLLQELQVTSALLKGHKLEILVLEMDPLSQAELTAQGQFANAVLVPTMEIPTSSTGRYTQVTTPVHKSLIIADGILGAASLLSYPLDIDRENIGGSVNLKFSNVDEMSPLPLQVVDVALGAAGLLSFRESVSNAISYEQDWSASGMPEVLQWLKAGTSPTESPMKPPLLNLIKSLLTDTSMAIQTDKSKKLDLALSSGASTMAMDSLKLGLSQWAERSHTELRDQLDIAFNGRRWRKLGWWKLFWRVDDVSMIASDILNQRFLTNAEKEIIFLAGRIEEAGILKNIEPMPEGNWAYKAVPEQFANVKLGSMPPPPRIQDLVGSPKDDLPPKIAQQPWPLHIPATRAFLSIGTVPALQALAQKLVLQTLTTSSVMSVLAALTYVSTLSTGLYEAGAVAAVGIVWSLRRMQGKWETGRRFWEGEVREEGRKAVRSVESVVGGVLTVSHRPLEGVEELEEAKKAVERAEAALLEYK